jgi:DNA-binding response OmpR family regulator
MVSAFAMRLLVIEDYKPLLKSLTKGFTEAGYAVDATGDGEEGLWYAQSNDYDVIILDLMLPGMDGLTLLKKLRNQGKTTHVLVLTAKDTVEDRVTGLETGADDYLVKPFSFSELLARVRALIRRSYQEKNPVIKIADLEIDTLAKTVKRGGLSIDLTPREYALLEYLAYREGEVVTRTEIWEHVYDFHDESTSNVVDVYISFLRQKIESPDKPKLIHTRRGMGYALECKE